MSEFKLIVAGGRDYQDKDEMLAQMFAYVEELPGEDLEVTIVTGMATGADKLAHEICVEEEFDYIPMPANWRDISVPGAVVKYNSYGAYNAVAGHMRNQAMADMSDGLLAFWDGSSTGTKDMIKRAEKAGLIVKVINYEKTKVR